MDIKTVYQEECWSDCVTHGSLRVTHFKLVFGTAQTSSLFLPKVVRLYYVRSVDLPRKVVIQNFQNRFDGRPRRTTHIDDHTIFFGFWFFTEKAKEKYKLTLPKIKLTSRNILWNCGEIVEHNFEIFNVEFLRRLPRGKKYNRSTTKVSTPWNNDVD